jgi:hypothetical protein
VDATAQMVVEFFIWEIGVAGVNAYHIYEVIYDEEEAKKTPGLPNRWSHAKFLEELVYDFIFLGRSMNAVADTDSMVSKTSTHALSICSFALFGQGEHEEGVYDLTGSYGRECYLATVPTVRITKGALAGGYFRHRLDGMRHNWIPASRTSHWQWCYCKLYNEYDEKDRKHFRNALPCNRIESEFSDVWYAMLTFAQYVTMIFMVQTCPHTPE